ncbi:Transcription factor, MADS-box [Dillenia turbinata]|uniref:Transcription factor, MADS-box n=1 Tax=Dillenia turbinata TaxID=194707 RepID=A0AAN8YSX0_9MAGN
MSTKKVKLAYIQNDSARKATFRKRKKGLMKKVSELTTLCGIEACAVIYSPHEQQPDVWPSALGAQNVLATFKRLPEMDQNKKMINQEGFIRQRMLKARDHLKRQQKDNREREITQVMNQCLTGKPLLTLGLVDLNDLGWLIDTKCKDIRKRLETMKQPDLPAALALPPPPPAAAPHPRMAGGLMQNLPMTSAPPESSMVMVPAGGVPAPHSHPFSPQYHHQMGVDIPPAAAAGGQWPTWTDLMNTVSNHQISFGGANEGMLLPYVDPTTPSNSNGIWPGPFYP